MFNWSAVVSIQMRTIQWASAESKVYWVEPARRE